MISATNNETVSLPLNIQRTYVYVKDTWGDKWKPIKYMRCIGACNVAAPEVDSADFVYQYGEIKREDESSFSTYERTDFVGKLVQVRIAEAPSTAKRTKKQKKKEKPLFTGIIIDDADQRLGASSGDQSVKAFGIGDLLDRWYIDYGFSLENDKRVRMGYCPKFNDKGQWGRALLGNRSVDTNPDAEGEYDIVYLFSAAKNAKTWNARQAIEYVLGFSPWVETMPVVLSGQVEALELIEDVWEAQGKSVFQFLNDVVNRKYGLGFKLKFEEGDPDRILVDVFTLIDQDVKVGNRTFPKNGNQEPFEFGDSFPKSALLGNMVIRTTSINTYDIIEVRGAKIKVAFNLGFGGSFNSATLTQGWTEGIETEYIDAEGAENPNDATEADRLRHSDRYNGVYRHFIIPPAFNWEVGDGTHDCETWTNIAPIPKRDGSVSFNVDDEDEDEGLYLHRSLYGKEFYRDLPFEKGKNYSVAKVGALPQDNNADGSVPEYVPMFAWIYDNVDGPNHGPATNKYVMLDKLTKEWPDAGLTDMHVRAVDREMGIEITGPLNHYMAINDFDAEAHPTNVLPEFDFRTLGAVVFVETDAHLRVKIEFVDESGEVDELARTLVVDNPACEYWYAHKDTVVDIVGGKLIRVHPDNQVVRDDSDKLRAIAEMYAAWYNRKRTAIHIPISEIGVFYEVGTFITTIDALEDAPEVNTVVTAIRWDFDNQQTEIETAYLQLDGSTIVGAMNPTKSFAGRKGAAGHGFAGKRG